jgi:hypothetical protein
VAYDPLLESARLIDSGLPAMPLRISRRRRFIPLAVDVDDDVAATCSCGVAQEQIPLRATC